MSIVLADLDFEEGTINMGGLAGYVFAIPARDVESIPAHDPLTFEVAGPIVLKPGKKFSSYYQTPDTGEVKDVEVGEKDSGSFEINAEWWMPSINGSVLKAKSDFANGAFILVMKDSNGVQRIVGSKDHPAYRVPGEITTGKAPKDRRGASFKWQAASPWPALIYTGSVPLVATT
jgi:hypothetical protein